MRIIAESSQYILEGEVADDTDLDGTFVLIEDSGEKLQVNGWLFNIERVNNVSNLDELTDMNSLDMF
jgi:hypothetical protein